MQLKVLACALAAGCVLSPAHGFDFHSDAAAECAVKHWSEIRAVANPKIKMMGTILPPEGVKKIKDLLGGASEVPEKPPSRDWLKKASDAVPESLLSMFGMDIIEKCVNKEKK